MASSLVFKVRRSESVLVKPAVATPIEVKSVSDWDNEKLELKSVSMILLYKSPESSATDRDPAEMIKRGLAEALVYYYPFAGRLKEGGEDDKLAVDCNAEGVLFVEADADIRLDQIRNNFRLPFPDLLYNKDPGTTPGSPLFTMQVTRLLCGGFALAFTFSHVICDGFGAAQFLKAVAELAGGAHEPSALPVWERQLLNARDPPPATFNNIVNTIYKPQSNWMAKPAPPTCRTVFFGKREVASIRSRLPEGLRDSCTSFELIVASVLHCRVTTVQHPPGAQVGVLFPVNCRNKFADRPIPSGYYGNTTFDAAFTCPLELLHDLGCAVEQVKKAKDAANEDYARSMVDIAVRKRRFYRPNFPEGCTVYAFNDWSRIGLSTLDFGSWGNPVFAGNPYNGKFPINLMVALTHFETGEEGRLVNLYMSQHAMDKLQLMLHL